MNRLLRALFGTPTNVADNVDASWPRSTPAQIETAALVSRYSSLRTLLVTRYSYIIQDGATPVRLLYTSVPVTEMHGYVRYDS